MAMGTHRWKMKSIKMRLTLYYSLTIVGFSLLLFLLVGYMLVSRFAERKNALVLEQLQVVSQAVEERMSVFVNNERILQREPEIQHYLKTGEGEKEAAEVLKDERYFQKGIRSLMLVDRDLEMISSFSMATSLGQETLPYQWISNGKDIYFSLPHNYPFSQNADDYMNNTIVTCCAAIREEESYEIEGYLLSNITRDYLFSGWKQEAWQLVDRMYVITLEGDILYRSGERYQEEERRIQELIRNTRAGAVWKNGKKDSYFIRRIESYPQWQVVGVISNKNLYHDIWNIQLFIGLICVCGVGIVLIVSHQISKKMTVPIYALKESMQALEMGEIPPKVEVLAYDEMEYLVKGFNSMVDDLMVYINAVENYGKETAQAEILALKYQLESLQSQIHPHFLYNTLNTVSYLALSERSQDIRQLIQELNRLLRATLSDTETFIRIERELEFLTAYVRIQEYRYPDLVEFRIECQEELKVYQIPKLILQPLVENALIHGIYPMGRPGRVKVCIIENEGNLEISVEDNGVGMEPGKKKGAASKKGFNRIGLGNVNERLHLYYGEAKLKIWSEIGKGTRVSFVIPEERERG